MQFLLRNPLIGPIKKHFFKMSQLSRGLDGKHESENNFELKFTLKLKSYPIFACGNIVFAVDKTKS